MNKIIKIALQNSFKEVNLDALLELIEASGNPTVASEVLLGCYEQPEIPTRVTTSNEVRYFVSYNKYTDRVEYTFKRTVTAYFKTEVEMKACEEYSHRVKINLYNHEKEDYPFEKTLIHTSDVLQNCRLKDWLAKFN